MIRGQVADFQARINVTFQLRGQACVQIECVVDTGFEGALTLPAAAVAAMDLPYVTELIANLADNTSVRTDVHAATIEWAGAEGEVAVLALGHRPLLGTALLEGFHLGVDFAEGGAVTITLL